MKRQFFLSSLFLFVCLIACNTPSSKNKTSDATSTSTSTATSTTTPTKRQSRVKPNAQSIVVAAQNAKAKSGTEVCVDLEVMDFTDVVSMQYSINWDPKLLQFLRVDGFNMKDLSKSNFGTNRAKDGKLTYSWYDQNVQGISLSNKTKIHQICYKAVGTSGSKAKILITEDPIIIEIVGKGNQFLKFFTNPATITIK